MNRDPAPLVGVDFGSSPLRIEVSILHPKHKIRNSHPSTVNPQPSTRNLNSETLNPRPETRNRDPGTPKQVPTFVTRVVSQVTPLASASNQVSKPKPSPLSREKGTTQVNFARKWPKPRPESGHDCLIVFQIARHPNPQSHTPSSLRQVYPPRKTRDYELLNDTLPSKPQIPQTQNPRYWWS